jgi:hypothetical protein
MLINDKIFSIGLNMFEKNDFIKMYTSKDENKVLVIAIDLDSNIKEKFSYERLSFIVASLTTYLLSVGITTESIHTEDHCFTIMGEQEALNFSNLDKGERFEEVFKVFNETYSADSTNLDVKGDYKFIKRELLDLDVINSLIEKKELCLYVKNFNRRDDDEIINKFNSLPKSNNIRIVIHDYNESHESDIKDKMEVSAFLELCNIIFDDFYKLINLDFPRNFSKAHIMYDVINKLYSNYGKGKEKLYINCLTKIALSDKFEMDKDEKKQVIRKISDVINNNNYNLEFKNILEQIQGELTE